MTAWMDLEGISEVSQAEKDKYYIMTNRDTDVGDKHMDTEGELGSEMNWEIGIIYVHYGYYV